MFIHQTKIFNSDSIKYLRIDYAPIIPSPQYICQKKYTHNEKEEIFKKEKIITYKNSDPKNYSNDIKNEGNIKIYKSKDIYKNVDNNQKYVYEEEKIITKRKCTNPKDVIKKKKKMDFAKCSKDRLLLIKHNKKDIKKECVQKKNIKVTNKNNNDNTKKNNELQFPLIINNKTENFYIKNKKNIISQKIKPEQKKIKPTQIINNSSYIKFSKKDHMMQTKQHCNQEEIKDISYRDINKKDKLEKNSIIKERKPTNNYTFNNQKKIIETNNIPSIKNKQNIDNKNNMNKVTHTDFIKLYPKRNIKEKPPINNTINTEKTKKYQALKNNIKKIKAQINKQNDIYKNIFISTQINKNNQTSKYINKKVTVKKNTIINNVNNKIKYPNLTKYAKCILSTNNISNKNDYVNQEKKKINKKIKILSTRGKNNNIKVNKIKNIQTDTHNHHLNERPNIIKSQESILYDLINQKKNKVKIKKFLQNADKENNISKLTVQEEKEKKKKIKKSHKRKFIHLYISSLAKINVESNKNNNKKKDSNHNKSIVQLKKKKRKIQTNKSNESINIIKKKENSNHIVYDNYYMKSNHKIKNILYQEYTNHKQETTYHDIRDKYQGYNKENQNRQICINYKNIYTNNNKKEDILFHINNENEQIYKKNRNINKYKKIDSSQYQEKQVHVKPTKIKHNSNNIIISHNNIKENQKKLKSLNLYKLIQNRNKEPSYDIASNIKANISNIYEKNKTYNKHINNHNEYNQIDPIFFNNIIQPNNLEKKNASSNISKYKLLYNHIYINKYNQKMEDNNININKNININYIKEKQILYYKMVSEKHKGIKNEFIELKPKNKNKKRNKYKYKNNNKINEINKDKRKIYTQIKKIKKKYIFIYDKRKILTKKHHSIIIIVNKFKIKENNLLLFLNKTKLNKYIPKLNNNRDVQNNTILNKDKLYISCTEYNNKYISNIQKMYLYFLNLIIRKNKKEQYKKGLNNYISVEKRQNMKKKKKNNLIVNIYNRSVNVCINVCVKKHMVLYKICILMFTCIIQTIYINNKYITYIYKIKKENITNFVLYKSIIYNNYKKEIAKKKKKKIYINIIKDNKINHIIQNKNIIIVNNIYSNIYIIKYNNISKVYIIIIIIVKNIFFTQIILFINIYHIYYIKNYFIYIISINIKYLSRINKSVKNNHKIRCYKYRYIKYDIKNRNKRQNKRKNIYIIYLYYYIINYLFFFLYNQYIIKYIHIYNIFTNKINRYLNKIIFYNRGLINFSFSICFQNNKIKKKIKIFRIIKCNYTNNDLYKKINYIHYQTFYQILIKRNKKKITNIKNIYLYNKHLTYKLLYIKQIKKKKKSIKKLNTNEIYKQKKSIQKKKFKTKIHNTKKYIYTHIHINIQSSCRQNNITNYVNKKFQEMIKCIPIFIKRTNLEHIQKYICYNIIKYNKLKTKKIKCIKRKNINILKHTKNRKKKEKEKERKRKKKIMISQMINKNIHRHIYQSVYQDICQNMYQDICQNMYQYVCQNIYQYVCQNIKKTLHKQNDKKIKKHINKIINKTIKRRIKKIINKTIHNQFNKKIKKILNKIINNITNKTINKILHKNINNILYKTIKNKIINKYVNNTINKTLHKIINNNILHKHINNINNKIINNHVNKTTNKIINQNIIKETTTTTTTNLTTYEHLKHDICIIKKLIKKIMIKMKKKKKKSNKYHIKNKNIIKPGLHKTNPTTENLINTHLGYEQIKKINQTYNNLNIFININNVLNTNENTPNLQTTKLKETEYTKNIVEKNKNKNKNTYRLKNEILNIADKRKKKHFTHIIIKSILKEKKNQKNIYQNKLPFEKLNIIKNKYTNDIIVNKNKVQQGEQLYNVLKRIHLKKNFNNNNNNDDIINNDNNNNDDIINNDNINNNNYNFKILTKTKEDETKMITIIDKEEKKNNLHFKTEKHNKMIKYGCDNNLFLRRNNKNKIIKYNKSNFSSLRKKHSNNIHSIQSHNMKVKKKKKRIEKIFLKEYKKYIKKKKKKINNCKNDLSKLKHLKIFKKKEKFNNIIKDMLTNEKNIKKKIKEILNKEIVNKIVHNHINKNNIEKKKINKYLYTNLQNHHIPTNCYDQNINHINKNNNMCITQKYNYQNNHLNKYIHTNEKINKFMNTKRVTLNQNLAKKRAFFNATEKKIYINHDETEDFLAHVDDYASTIIVEGKKKIYKFDQFSRDADDISNFFSLS